MAEFDWSNTTAGALTTFGAALLSAFATWLAARRHTRAEIEQHREETEKARLEVARLKDEAGADFNRAVNERVQIMLDANREEISRLRNEVHRLTDQVSELQRELRAIESARRGGAR